MTTSAELRELFVTVLTGATDAGSAVFSPFDWPTSGDAYPAILVRAPKERKQSLGPNAPLFDVTATIEVIARTKSVALLGDAGSAVALAAAERLKWQIEVALINNPALWVKPNGARRISQFASVDSELTTNSEGSSPLGNLLMHIEVDFTQGPEDFYPITGTPIEGFDAGVQMPPGTVEPGFSITFPPFIQS
jgi:hypothetical protein